FLSYYPRPAEEAVQSIETMTENVVVADNTPVADQEVIMLELPHAENSYLGRIGRALEPIFAPFGLDWRASVAILSGASAKEIIVSTLGVLYSVEDAEDEEVTLSSHLLASGNYTRSAALAMIIFVMLYFHCVATVAAIAQEAGGWKWALLSIAYNTTLAWVMAFIAYNIGNWIGL
ncbi:MAG: ferrous iron transporter B, partial [Alistipes sp.]|nr:ferrous iron transporter B [Alistipes sp.]